MNRGSEMCTHPKFQKVSVTGLRRGDLFLQSYFDSSAFSGPVVVLDFLHVCSALKRGYSVNFLPDSENLQKINVG